MRGGKKKKRPKMSKALYEEPSMDSLDARVRGDHPFTSRLYDEWFALSDYSSRGLCDLTSICMILWDEGRRP